MYLLLETKQTFSLTKLELIFDQCCINKVWFCSNIVCDHYDTNILLWTLPSLYQGVRSCKYRQTFVLFNILPQIGSCALWGFSIAVWWALYSLTAMCLPSLDFITELKKVAYSPQPSLTSKYFDLSKCLQVVNRWYTQPLQIQVGHLFRSGYWILQLKTTSNKCL